MSIARWTIGDVHENGFDCLKYSIKSFASLYPEFEYYVCYNSISRKKLDCLDNLNLNLTYIEQKECVFAGKESVWKYTPPRINLDKREIFIDNDIVFFSRIPTIEEFLQKDSLFICEDDMRFYGRFGQNIKKHYNAGLFGVPKQFNLYDELKKHHHLPNAFLDKADEQGLTVSTVLSHGALIVKKQEMPIVHPEGTFCDKSKKFQPFVWNHYPAIHFVRLNVGDHYYFNLFKSFYKLK